MALLLLLRNLGDRLKILHSLRKLRPTAKVAQLHQHWTHKSPQEEPDLQCLVHYLSGCFHGSFYRNLRAVSEKSNMQVFYIQQKVFFLTTFTTLEPNISARSNIQVLCRTQRVQHTLENPVLTSSFLNHNQAPPWTFIFSAGR